MTFGDNLAEVMTALDMTQADLAERTGITRAAVCQILSGEREPSLKTIVKILEAIPVKFERLVK